MPSRSQRSDSTGATFRRQLDAALRKLIDEFEPEKIYLFGSLAAGHPRPESSIDVLIVSNKVGQTRIFNRIKRAIAATEEAVPNLAPLVYTEEELELLASQGDGFISDILDEGKLLYQRHKASH